MIFFVLFYMLRRWTSQNLTITILKIVELINYEVRMFFFYDPFFYNDFCKIAPFEDLLSYKILMYI